MSESPADTAPGAAAAAARPGKGRLSLRRNFAWTFFGSLVAYGAKYSIMVVLAKLATKEVVGSFAIATAVGTLITILSQLQLRVALVTDAGDEHAFGVYHATRLVATLFAMAVATAVALIAYPEIALLVVLITAGQAMTSLRDIWGGLAQKHERMNIDSVGNMIDAFVSSALFCTVFLVWRSLEWAAVGLFLGHALTLVAYDMPRVRRVLGHAVSTAPIWDLGRMRRLFWVVLPLGLTTALVSVNTNLPRLFIEGVLGKEALGYFAPIAYFVLIGQLFIGALSRAASPRLAILYRQDRARFGKLLAKLLVLAAGLGSLGVLAAILVGEPVLRIVYSDEYAQEAHLLVMLMAANGILLVNSFLGVAISAARFFKVQTVTYAGVVLATLIACIVLVPRWGLEGAAWSMIFAACVNTTINAGVCAYVYRQPRPASTAHP